MEMPWDVCKKMMSSMSKTSELATFATPEVRQLFEEWAAQIEEEILSYVKDFKINETDKIAEHFKLSRESVTYFLTRLAGKGKINLKAQKVE
jgi:DNA-binding transcriptional MerR regulator